MSVIRNTLNRIRLLPNFARTQSSDAPPPETTPTKPATAMTDGSKQKPDSEWRAVLSPEQFRILRQKGTELAHTGEYENHKEEGIYSCAGCATPLYRSTTKFSSGCGWPAFFDGDFVFILSPSSCLLIPRYSHPRSSQSTRRQDYGHHTHRDHLCRLWWPSRPCIQGRRIPNTKYVT